jgi:4-hydroxy-3-methylbut-2-en-1-yl diphosphate reductase
MKIVKTKELGFCFGVRRAVKMLEKAARDNPKVESLGPVVHNDQVSQRLEKLGIHVIKNLAEVESEVVAISSHGVSPEIEAELRSMPVTVIDTTCPFVRRAQTAARRLSETGFFVVVYGEAEHPEIKGILSRLQNQGIATLDSREVEKIKPIPGHLAVLSQTTQVPENYKNFVKNIIDLALQRDAEIRVLDTICHDVRKRQSDSLELASKVDLMLVIGGKSSANTRRLYELCSFKTESHLLEDASEIESAWLKNKKQIGITSGTSTPDESIEEVVNRLTVLANQPPAPIQ